MAGSARRVVGPDEFPLEEGHALEREHELITRLLAEESELRRQATLETGVVVCKLDLGRTSAGREIAAGSPEASRDLLRAILPRVIHLRVKMEAIRASSKPPLEPHTKNPWNDTARSLRLLADVLAALLRRKLPFEAGDIEALTTWPVQPGPPDPWQYPLPAIIAAAKGHCGSGSPPPEVRRGLEKLEEGIRKLRGISERDRRDLLERIESVLVSAPRVRLQPVEPWTVRALADLEGMEPSRRAAWDALLFHAQAAKSGKPSSKWSRAAAPLLDAVGLDDFREKVVSWFELAERSGKRFDLHRDLLRGLVWFSSLREDDSIARSLTGLAINAFRKLPGIGPRAPKVGNACLHALGEMPGKEAVGQLAILKTRVKQRSAQSGIEKALEAAAGRAGLSRQDLEELAVPVHGLTSVGRRSERLGDYTAELTVSQGEGSWLQWTGPQGKRQASVPAAVKRDFAEELKQLRQAEKDIRKMLPAQAERLDRLLLEAKTWPLPVWRERYFDHPLVGVLARRLIWRFRRPGAGPADAITGIHRDGAFLVDAADRTVPDLPPETAVELWHPLQSLSDEIIGWRSWLETNEVRQPFKQAHREVYVLTDAERRTRVYSNRFAAHVLRQHQFNALCAARGWRSQLRLLVDASYPPPSLEILTWGLRAEFWVEGIGGDYGSDTNDAGVFHRVATDQVRFYRLGAAQAHAHAMGGGYSLTDTGHDVVPLEEVPPLVLSEVMRDVDLFVGVASVGNDPSWHDGGPGGTHRDYWQSYAFGDLAESARTRRQVLEGLLPRLKIAARAKLSDRFLIVRGDLRTYKIHLGSGNILMEPNDQYLCIVRSPQAQTAERVFLPFEGDGMLAVILSKAFLLAEDTKIRDSTIVTQIRQ